MIQPYDIKAALQHKSKEVVSMSNMLMASRVGVVLKIDGGVKNRNRVRVNDDGRAKVFEATDTVMNEHNEVMAQYHHNGKIKLLVGGLMDLACRLRNKLGEVSCAVLRQQCFPCLL
jgi:hypothetical protein